MKSFEEYISENLHPFGLRVRIFPTFDNLDTSFKAAWEDNLKVLSKNMMSLLINEYQKCIKGLVEKLEKIQIQMLSLKTHPSYAESEEKLKCHLEQFNKNILIKKSKKLQRDRKAFEDGKEYKWQLNQTNARTLGQYDRNIYTKNRDFPVYSRNSSPSVSLPTKRSETSKTSSAW